MQRKGQLLLVQSKTSHSLLNTNKILQRPAGSGGVAESVKAPAPCERVPKRPRHLLQYQLWFSGLNLVLRGKCTNTLWSSVCGKATQVCCWFASVIAHMQGKPKVKKWEEFCLQQWCYNKIMFCTLNILPRSSPPPPSSHMCQYTIFLLLSIGSQYTITGPSLTPWAELWSSIINISSEWNLLVKLLCNFLKLGRLIRVLLVL